MNKHLCSIRLFPAIAVLALPLHCLAGIDKPWQDADDDGTGNVAGAMFLLALVAFAIHLIERGEFLDSLRDLAKGLSVIATMYLMVFWLVVCVVAIALALQAIGMEKSMSAFIAIPTGLVVAYKLFAMYQDWRKPGPKQ